MSKSLESSCCGTQVKHHNGKVVATIAFDAEDTRSHSAYNIVLCELHQMSLLNHCHIEDTFELSNTQSEVGIAAQHVVLLG